MQYFTVGQKHNKGKVAKVKCVKNGDLKNLSLKNNCFLLIILTAGRLEFKLKNEAVCAAAPAFLCFGENANLCFFLSEKRNTPAFIFTQNF